MFEDLAAPARAEVVPAEFLLQQLVAVNDPDAPLHLRLGWEASAALTHGPERSVRRCGRDWSWRTVLSGIGVWRRDTGGAGEVQWLFLGTI